MEDKTKPLFKNNTVKAWSNITGYGFISIQTSDNKKMKSPWNHFCVSKEEKKKILRKLK